MGKKDTLCTEAPMNCAADKSNFTVIAYMAIKTPNILLSVLLNYESNIHLLYGRIAHMGGSICILIHIRTHSI